MLNAMTAHGGRPEAAILTPLDWVRWGLVAIPVFTVIPPSKPWLWPLIVLALIASIPLLRLPRTHPWMLPVAMWLVVACTGTIWIVAPIGWSTVAMFSTTFYGVRTLSRAQSAFLVAITAAAITVNILYRIDNWRDSSLLYAVLVVLVLLGLNRESRAARLEQAELALARAQTATEEHARAAALAERTRIARELHDVLAHSLAGLALNLQGARLMLVRDGASPDAVAQIERAQKLAADGLSEARSAVAALRDDLVPVTKAVADLVTGYRMDTGATAELTVEGEPRELAAAAGTTVVRAVQESLSNTRKYAQSAEVRVTLMFGQDHVEVTVQDKQGRRPPEPVAAGYGLRGMRERVELLSGELDSGPVEDGWRVHLTVPA
ncbi:MAG: two-component sensor histidine kinase [Amycolatopsis sp.]|jgi:signal transduction histidine kinase|uniref:sensor histidine kinase n=1 Tax=Amycolatopsis sp. TaxID=37632 RepID=UPI00262BB571|nr:sensor histidine kinase [Amycolatopsis sp.]MCU1680712.1 two-component sensor histidine kinase [Amycolatopsis sp.]